MDTNMNKLEHCENWKKRSLIEDAKFDSVIDNEFQKREENAGRGKLSANKFSAEELLAENGHAEKEVLTEDRKEVSRPCNVILKLKQCLVKSLPDVLRLFEDQGVAITALESRPVSDSPSEFEVFVTSQGPLDAMRVLVKLLHLSDEVLSLEVVPDPAEEKPEPWFPKHVSELDSCNHLITKFEPELDTDHPGFCDKQYRERRKKIADVAFDYRHGAIIPDVEYSQEENETWGHVYNQAKGMFATHCCKEHVRGFTKLEEAGIYSPDFVPQLQSVSDYLKRESGFSLRPVAGLLSARDFLSSLAFRVFQCTQYIRHPSKPNHSPEPDCVHELLGHVPMMCDPSFAQFSQDMGLASLGASDETVVKLSTLYWFTVEFGLLRENGQLRAYGAGLLSAYGELTHALSDVPEHKPFSVAEASVQKYQDATYQPIYFVAEDFSDMQHKMRVYARQVGKLLCYDPYSQSVRLLDSSSDLKVVVDATNTQIEALERATMALSKSHSTAED